MGDRRYKFNSFLFTSFSERHQSTYNRLWIKEWRLKIFFRVKIIAFDEFFEIFTTLKDEMQQVFDLCHCIMQ